jgi:hypothetical protein
MTNTLQDGLELAARYILKREPGLFGENILRRWAAEILALTPGMTDDAIEAAFERFKQAYPERTKGLPWTPAKAAFIRAVTKRKKDPEKIIVGTEAFTATNPDPDFVPMPATFINQDRFEVVYSNGMNGHDPTGENRTSQASARHRNGNGNGATGSDAILAGMGRIVRRRFGDKPRSDRPGDGEV